MLSVGDVFEQSHEIIGKIVEFECFFIFDGRKSYFENYEDCESDEGIEVFHENILSELFGKLSPYVGGSVLYYEKARLKGRFGMNAEGVIFVDNVVETHVEKIGRIEGAGEVIRVL